MNEYNVCGVMVMATPDRVATVTQALAGISGVEVHASSEEGRIVVTVEGEHSADCADTFTRFSDIKGVVATALVYHEIDSNTSHQESAK